MTHAAKFLIVGFDGFRPELMSPELTPTLWNLARGGSLFRNHRCCFPSETFSNLPSLVAGTPIAGHGMVANRFFEPSFGLDVPYYTGLIPHIDAAAAANNGHPFTTPSIGDFLAREGRSMSVISTCEPGGARILNPKAAEHAGHLTFATDSIETSLPQDRARAIVAELGEPPSMSWKLAYDPNTRLHHSYVTDAFLVDVEKNGLPDVSLLWYCDPDHAFHAFGIGSEEARIGIADADAGLAKVLRVLDSHPDRDRLNVLVLSDHSHITLAGKVDTMEIFADAGISATKTQDTSADIWVSPSYCNSVRLREDNPKMLEKTAQALMEHPAVGMVFTKQGEGEKGAVPGALPLSALDADHTRSPDIKFIYRTTDDKDEHGFQGTCLHDCRGMKDGQSNHGGLHPKELHNLLVANGPAFAEGLESDTHSGIADVTPTIIAAMGLTFQAASHGGRVLEEAFKAEPDGPAETPITLTAEFGDFAQELSLTRVGEQVYPDGGRRLI